MEKVDELKRILDEELKDKEKSKNDTDKEETKKESDEDKSKDKKESEKKDSKKEDSKEDSEKDDIKSSEDKGEEDFEIPFIDPSVYTMKEKNKEKKEKKKHTALLVLAGVLGLFLMAYIGGVVYFFVHFTPRTIINGRDMSGMTVSEIDKILDTEMNDYEFVIQYKDGNDVLYIGDGNLTAVKSDTGMSLKMKDNPFLWPCNIFNRKEYSVIYDVTYDDAALRQRIASSSFMDESKMKKSTNAEITMADGKVLLVPDVTGTTFDKEQVINLIMAAVEEGVDNISIEANDCYVKADVTVDDPLIQKSVESAKNYLAIDACYDFKGYIYTIPKDEMCDMAYLDTDGTVKLDKTAIENWAKAFAVENTTFEKDRKFRTHDGRLIYVNGADDDYGWELDPEREATELYEKMCTMESFVKEPAVITEGYAWWELNDIGPSYIEIDLEDQMVYVYQDGKRVYDTPCVSGYDGGILRTPGGLYGLTYKANNAILRGEDYASPVSYWMPFNRDIGMHDATWRSDDEYVPDRYTYDGSHGCVNLPFAAAAFIFDYVEAGCPIVCYWDSEVATATLED